jgi:pimeloyl-ACP methyl ester carboxylesterase
MGLGGLFVDRDLLDGDFHARFIAPVLASRRRMEGSLRYLHGIGWDVVDGMRAVHARLPMPVQMIWGVDDPTFPIAIAREMTKQFTTPPELVEVPRAALLPHEEQPERMLAALVPFLAAERTEPLRRVH